VINGAGVAEAMDVYTGRKEFKLRDQDKP